jgi:hypothetical protein
MMYILIMGNVFYRLFRSRSFVVSAKAVGVLKCDLINVPLHSKSERHCDNPNETYEPQVLSLNNPVLE